MKLKRLNQIWNRITRNDMNENFDKIERDFNGVVDVVSNKAYDQVVDAAKLNWLEPVAVFADLRTTYPNALEGDTAMAREVVDGVNKVYRYNGTQWKEIQQISADAVNEVDERLSQQLSNITAVVTTDKLNSLYIQALIDSGLYKTITVPPDADITLDTPLDFTDSTVEDFDGNGADIKAINGAFITGKKYTKPIKIRNLTIDGLDKSNGATGISSGVLSDKPWGSSYELENVDIKNFKIATDNDSVFNLIYTRGRIENCGIGIYLHNRSGVSVNDSLSNVNTFNHVYIDGCDYNVYIDNTRNVKFNSCILERANYSVIVGNSIRNISFDNTWLEANNIAHISCGIIDITKLTLTLSDDDSNLRHVKFRGTRYGTNPSPVPFVGGVSSQYYHKGYDLDWQNDWSDKFDYKNLIPVLPSQLNDVASADGKNVGSETFVGYDKTQFGMSHMYKFSATNVHHLARLMVVLGSTSVNNIKLNDVVMLKFSVKVNRDDNKTHYIRSYIGNSAGNGLSKSRDIYMEPNKFTTVSVVLRVDNSSNYNELQKIVQIIFNADSQYDGFLSVELSDVMLINLTTIFGKHYEPSPGTENEFSKYFPFKYGFKPTVGKYKGYSYYDETENRWIYWDGVSWDNTARDYTTEAVLSSGVALESEGSMKLTKSGNTVQLNLRINSAGINTQTVVMSLPQRCRPTQSIYTNATATGEGLTAPLTVPVIVATNGDVRIPPTEARNYTRLSLTWLV